MLKVEGLRFEYKGAPVLKGLDVEVLDGETVGVVGPNGVGKTTLIRLISGVLRPSAGQIRVNGADSALLSSSERARLVSVVPQNPPLPVGFTVQELVLMGRNSHLKLLQWEGRRDLRIAGQAMELTETAHLASRAVGTLSGGERQRAVVAMALAQEAPVLLLDEPTSSLDLAHQTRVLDLVRSVQRKRGGAVLITLHDLTLAALYCNRLIMLADGRSHAEGAPADVLTEETVRSVYGAEVSLLSHPVGGTPVVLPVAGGDGGPMKTDTSEPAAASESG